MVPLPRNGIEVSVVTNTRTSVTRNAVTNSYVAYTMKSFPKQRYRYEEEWAVTRGVPYLVHTCPP
jgi:hypothetical protein